MQINIKISFSDYMICCDPFPWYPFFPSKWLHALLISVSTWFAATLPTIWTSPTITPQLQIIAPLLLIRWTQLTGWIRNLVLICSGPLFDDPIMIYNIIHDDTNMISYFMVQIWYTVSYLMIQIWFVWRLILIQACHSFAPNSSFNNLYHPRFSINLIYFFWNIF